MARHSHWCQVFAIVILALIAMCVPAQAQQFSATKNVSNNSDYSFTPRVAVDSNGTIYLAWEDDTAAGSNILFSRSTDGGATFSTPTNLSNASDYSFNPRIAINATGSVNVVWEYETADNTDIMFSHSSDAGVSFTPPINLSNDPADSENEQIATDATGNIYVVWENDSLNLGVLFSRSTDGGATFSAPAVLSTNTSGSYSAQIAIGANGNLSVVWEDDAQSASDVSFSHSSDHGATFSSPQSLSYHTGNSGSQQIAIDLTGNIDVVWANETSGKFDIFFTRSVDNGATFSTPIDVSNGSGNAQNPQIGLDAKGNINLVWEDNMPSDIYFARSTNGGGSFSAPVNISNNGGFSVDPFLTVDVGGNVNVAWEDDTTGNKDIFFARSTDLGATFSTPVNLSNDPLLSLAPDMAADKNGNINVTWQDSTPGVSQVFFSRLAVGTVANQPPVANAGVDQTIACSAPNGSSITLNGSQSSDPDGDALTFVWTNETGTIVGTTAIVQVNVGVGAHTFTLTVTDPGGLSSTASTHVTVADTTPPTLQVSLSPNVLWPPNHTLIPITATVEASDTCDANPAVTLVSITSSEPDNGLGDGDRPNDIQAIGGGPIPAGTEVSSFLLRAERSGMGTGRIYTVTYMAKDASGNTASASAQVIVPIEGTTTTTADPPRQHADPRPPHRHKKKKKHDDDRGHDKH